VAVDRTYREQIPKERKEKKERKTTTGCFTPTDELF